MPKLASMGPFRSKIASKMSLLRPSIQDDTLIPPYVTLSPPQGHKPTRDAPMITTTDRWSNWLIAKYKVTWCVCWNVLYLLNKKLFVLQRSSGIKWKTKHFWTWRLAHLHIVIRKVITLVGTYRDFVFVPFSFAFPEDQYEIPLFTVSYFFIIPSTKLISV